MLPQNSLATSPTRAIRTRLTITRMRVRNGLVLVTLLLLTASTLLKSINVAWVNDHMFGLLRVLWVDA